MFWLKWFETGWKKMNVKCSKYQKTSLRILAAVPSKNINIWPVAVCCRCAQEVLQGGDAESASLKLVQVSFYHGHVFPSGDESKTNKTHGKWMKMGGWWRSIHLFPSYSGVNYTSKPRGFPRLPCHGHDVFLLSWTWSMCGNICDRELNYEPWI